MYPIEIPDSLLELADLTRPDHLEVGEVPALENRVMRSEGLVSSWVEDQRFWDKMCRDGFAQTLGGILPHVTNGEFGLAALIQSRADVPEDPALRARKALSQMPMLLSLASGAFSGMNQASRLVQILDDLFTAASGGLLMSANLITQEHSLAVHSGIIEAGAKTVLGAAKSLKQHVGKMTQEQ